MAVAFASPIPAAAIRPVSRAGFAQSIEAAPLTGSILSMTPPRSRQSASVAWGRWTTCGGAGDTTGAGAAAGATAGLVLAVMLLTRPKAKKIPRPISTFFPVPIFGCAPHLGHALAFLSFWFPQLLHGTSVKAAPGAEFAASLPLSVPPLGASLLRRPSVPRASASWSWPPSVLPSVASSLQQLCVLRSCDSSCSCARM